MALQRPRVLVLNSSYEPLSVCDVRTAILLLFGGKAVALTHHPDRTICTITQCYPMPSIVRLTVYARIPYRRLSPSRKNILRRDNFQCQYCGRKDQPLTLDHVLPRSRGGGDSWENLITACQRCNSLKGDRTPREAGMSTLTKPARPSRILFLQQETALCEEWKPYLYMS